MKQTHANAIENLVVFATLVLVAHIAGVNNEATAIACAVYFWARVVHFVVFGFGIPWIRTLSFVIGVGCQNCIGLADSSVRQVGPAFSQSA